MKGRLKSNPGGRLCDPEDAVIVTMPWNVDIMAGKERRRKWSVVNKRTCPIATAPTNRVPARGHAVSVFVII